ncbi:MAG: ThiF family adenylyltransferase [Coriobacteriales bacterium]
MHHELEKLELLVGDAGLELLSAATVTVLGVGGVGSACAMALARAGVGHLVFVDGDVVSQTNLNRQVIAFRSTLGQKKVQVLGRMVADVSPDIEVRTIDRFVTPDDVPRLLDERCGRVVDSLDTVATKLAVAEHCERHDIPLVSSMGAGKKFQPELLEFADIYDTSVCPLCKVMRREARSRGIEHLRVLYSRETPVHVEAEPGAARSERTDLGTVSYMPVIMGNMLAADVICHLLGIARPADRR